MTDRDPGTERHTEAGMVRLGRMQTRAWSPGRRKQEAGRTRTGGQGDRGAERPRLRGTRTRAWSLGGRKWRKDGDRETRGQRDTRKPGWCVSVGCRLGLGPRGAEGRRKEKEGEGRRREEKGEPGQGDRQTQRPELHRPRMRPGRPGWKKEAGGGRRENRDRGTDRRRDPSCAGHGRGQAGRDGRRKKGEAGQGDRETRTTRDTDSGLVPG